MNRKGFTLIEIMIVVMIITLLAAFAAPHLIRGKNQYNYIDSEQEDYVFNQEKRHSPLNLIVHAGRNRKDMDINIYELNLEDGTRCIIVKEWNDAVGISCNWE